MEALWIAALLGIVEGLTEFLPVSSTGHLILAGELLGLHGAGAATFEIVIQLGAILAVVILYWSRFLGLIMPSAVLRGGLPDEGRPRGFAGLRGMGLLVLTTLPGATLGLFAGDFIKSVLFSPASVVLALVAGAVLMLVVEGLVARRDVSSVQSLDDLTAAQALAIGCCQCLALWPGFSRSASTIMGGMLLGLRRDVAAEYSFIAAVPILVGAAGYDLLKSLSLLNVADIPFFAVGILLAFVSAVLAIRSFLALLGCLTLRPFALYRLLLAIPVYGYMVR